jgi:ankyrin repeat protein
MQSCSIWLSVSKVNLSAASPCLCFMPRPAHCGAAKGQLETLRILGTHGANLWVRNVKGDYPLHEAVVSGRKDLVRWLLTQRPDAVNSPNNDGRCPLHIAAINNNVEMCKVCRSQVPVGFRIKFNVSFCGLGCFTTSRKQ